ncbi:hypothetical protein C8R46DRAFT_1357283 [Mycena filopes]|nr:hypothetical protein C8R46DRAFT_1357278 [Mycena filopes]KAJ7152832.1 hypothetical protein C8R46DRAFT_1357283 [Mycena filopes]
MSTSYLTNPFLGHHALAPVAGGFTRRKTTVGQFRDLLADRVRRQRQAHEHLQAATSELYTLASQIRTRHKVAADEAKETLAAAERGRHERDRASDECQAAHRRVEGWWADTAESSENPAAIHKLKASRAAAFKPKSKPAHKKTVVGVSKRVIKRKIKVVQAVGL